MCTEADQEMREVPEDLMIEICVRLPVKSIGRFKSVSKRWNCFLSTPEFVKSHTHRAPQWLFLLGMRSSLHVITLDDHNGGRSRALKSPVTHHYQLLGSCNGLVLLSVTSSLVVLNPVTLKYRMLPQKYKAKDKLMYGLGYNIAEDDYKVVEFAYGENLVKIFSLKTRCYKEYSAPDDLLYSGPDLGRNTIYAEGRLYWYNPTTRVINAFDLSTEKFEQLPFPTDFYSLGTNSFSFKQLGGCFAIVTGFHWSDSQINVWIMEKPGDWRKYTIPDYSMRFYDVVSRLRESELVLSVQTKKLVAYNCETKVWRTLDIDALPYPLSWGTILTFKESLVGLQVIPYVSV